MGKALVPAFAKLAETLQPIIERFADWSEKNPELFAKMVLIGGAVASLAVVLGTLGLILPPIIAGMGLLAAAVKGRDEQTVETTDYHNIVVFGAAAENSARFLRKGAIAFVEGKLQTRSWDKDGVKQYRTEILADRVQFGPKVSGSNQPKSDSVLPDYPVEDINPEDVPF